jgi:hypothetical protein
MSQAADRKIDDFMTVPRSRPGRLGPPLTPVKSRSGTGHAVNLQQQGADALLWIRLTNHLNRVAMCDQ